MTKFILIALFSILPILLHAQMIATLEVDLEHPSNGILTPASTNLDQITSVKSEELSLVRVRDGSSRPVPFQVSQSENGRLIHWIIVPSANHERKVVFQLVKTRPNSSSSEMKVITENGAAIVQDDSRKLVRYYFEKLNAPAGADSSYGRSGFIHPLWSPAGHELTRIQPPDHFHHYGIWNPWTHVLYKGDTIDFWNLNKKEGTVRFAKFMQTTDGSVFGEYKALHEHVVLKDLRNEVALNEVQTIRVYKPSDDYYLLDISIDLTCAGKDAFHIMAYRYGGLGWRTTGEWDNKNSEVLTSEDKTRKDADGSTARWCLVQGAIGNSFAGAVMLSSPANYNHPEPLRIWPENQYDRGDMFANFAPTKNKDWRLVPGQTYSLRYRFVVFDGKFNREKCESAWQYFATPARVTVKKS